MNTECKDIKQSEFIRLAEYMNENYGIKISEQKKTLIVSRLSAVLAENKLDNFHDYLDYVINDKTGAASKILINKLTTNLTYFMREKKHFDFLQSTILSWIRGKAKDKDFRIWCAGCSTGEEAYTIAMIIDEYLGFSKNEYNYQVLATDISRNVLSKAEQGIYKNEQLDKLPEQWVKKYFVKLDDDRYKVSNELKKLVVFREFNLKTKVFPFRKKFHTIFCRNVMIYFDMEMKMSLINKFYEATEIGGYLLIGHSESIDKTNAKYKYLFPATYRKEQ